VLVVPIDVRFVWAAFHIQVANSLIFWVTVTLGPTSPTETTMLQLQMGYMYLLCTLIALPAVVLYLY